MRGTIAGQTRRPARTGCSQPGSYTALIHGPRTWLPRVTVAVLTAAAGCGDVGGPATEFAVQPQPRPAQTDSTPQPGVRPPAESGSGRPSPREAATIRFATFNASLSRRDAGTLIRDLETGTNPQAKQVAEIIQHVRPDVLLINELDYDPQTSAARLLHDRYLNKSQGGQEPLFFAHRFTAPVNTGAPTGLDLDRDGKQQGPADAFGFGYFPGQYGMAVFSNFAIATAEVRTFQTFLWKEMPDARLPRDPNTATPYYDETAQQVLRLSSKSMWDVPVRVGSGQIHFLVCHPTPPVFDGPEDRNGQRNYDEIRLLADYVSPTRASYIRDDQFRSGGLGEDTSFVIAGDLNADPLDGDSVEGAVAQLLNHPQVNRQRIPSSLGAVEDSKRQAMVNIKHRGDPALDTADFSDEQSGNLRIDYVLPSADLTVVDCGVFWPTADEPTRPLIECSDHRLVWVDIQVDP